MNRLKIIIYLSSVLPFLFGSIVFFYWYYQRTLYAQSINIEFLALIAILTCLILGIMAIILCTVYFFRYRANWKSVVIPLVILASTYPFIEIYDSLHSAFNQKVFVKIINDLDGTELQRIYSDNFEIGYFKDDQKEFVISYYPVYRFDWNEEISSGWYNYKVNPVIVEFQMNYDSTFTSILPEFSKGMCRTIRMSKLYETCKNELQQ